MNRFKFSMWAIAAVLGSTSAALAQNLSFVEIAGTGVPVPGTGGTYTSFGLPVADREDSDIFYFEAQSSAGIDGIYDYPQFQPSGIVQSVGLIANATMAAPTGGTFAKFSNLSSGFRGFGFVAQDSNGVQGVYVASAYAPSSFVMITETGSSPVAGSAFGNFESLSVSGYGEPEGPLAINGEIVSDVGVYNFSIPAFALSVFPPATFSELASTSITPAGAPGPFSSFGPPSYKASETTNHGDLPGRASFVSAIRATAGGVQGIYDTFGGFGTPQLLANTSTSIPSGTGHYTSFGDPIASSSEIAFTADYTTSTGIQQGIFSFGQYYDDSGGILQLYQILATGQIAPDSGGAHFASFGTIALAEIGGLFVATLDNGIEGLYSFDDFQYEVGVGPLYLDKVLDTTEMLDGKSIADIEISSEAVTSGGYAFKVDFTDGSQGIFTTPEPASLCLLALPLPIISRHRRLI